VRNELLALGGTQVCDLAIVNKPGGRYKTNYVDAAHGIPLLSGGQLLEATPINLQYMHPSVFKDVADYQLRRHWIAYPADGRAEAELGTPVVISPDRDGWLASGHVGRVIAREGVNSGCLYVAMATRHSQLQLKATSSGSVVDSTFAHDLERVVFPSLDGIDGDAVLTAWDQLAVAMDLDIAASAEIDRAVDSIATSRVPAAPSVRVVKA
jgi:hypothetical protein